MIIYVNVRTVGRNERRETDEKAVRLILNLVDIYIRRGIFSIHRYFYIREKGREGEFQAG